MSQSENKSYQKDKWNFRDNSNASFSRDFASSTEPCSLNISALRHKHVRRRSSTVHEPEKLKSTLISKKTDNLDTITFTDLPANVRLYLSPFRLSKTYETNEVSDTNRMPQLSGIFFLPTLNGNLQQTKFCWEK